MRLNSEHPNNPYIIRVHLSLRVSATHEFFRFNLHDCFSRETRRRITGLPEIDEFKMWQMQNIYMKSSQAFCEFILRLSRWRGRTATSITEIWNKLYIERAVIKWRLSNKTFFSFSFNTDFTNHVIRISMSRYYCLMFTFHLYTSCKLLLVIFKQS